MHSFSCAHCLAAGRGRRSCLALHGSASGSGLRSPYASSPMHQAVSCSTLFYLWTGSSSPVASHPAFRRRSFLRLRTASVLSDGDFHPIVGAHSQAHVEVRRRRTLKRGDLAPLWINSGDDMLDRSVLSCGIHCLKNEKYRPTVLCVEHVLQFGERLNTGLQRFLNARFIFWPQVARIARINILESELLANLDAVRLCQIMRSFDNFIFFHYTRI